MYWEKHGNADVLKEKRGNSVHEIAYVAYSGFVFWTVHGISTSGRDTFLGSALSQREARDMATTWAKTFNAQGHKVA